MIDNFDIISSQKIPDSVVANSAEFEHALQTYLILLSPLAPSFSAELWEGLMSTSSRQSAAEVPFSSLINLNNNYL